MILKKNILICKGVLEIIPNRSLERVFDLGLFLVLLFSPFLVWGQTPAYVSVDTLHHSGLRWMQKIQYDTTFVQSVDTLQDGVLDTTEVMHIDSTLITWQDSINLSLVVFTPHKANPVFTVKKSETQDSNVVMKVAAAFTAANLKNVVGDYVAGGVLKTNKRDKETGYCLIYNDIVEIDFISKSQEAKQKAIQNKGSYFQQMLLLCKGDTVECTLFRKQKPTFRRCLALKENKPVIIESEDRLTFEEFANILKQEGIQDAIYLDMGTWSEGFYKNRQGEHISIGHLKANTKHQVCWLIFKP